MLYGTYVERIASVNRHFVFHYSMRERHALYVCHKDTGARDQKNVAKASRGGTGTWNTAEYC